MKKHIVCLTFDFDAQSGFIARGLTTPTPISRGEFGVVASGRILDFLKRMGIASTWFVPGFTLESYPQACERIFAEGHEIGHHSWAHIVPATQTLEEESADFERAQNAIKRLTGQGAVGYRSPAWDLSPNTLDLLQQHGFLYDSSLMGDDYSPYFARQGDRAELGQPFSFGNLTQVLEMPISWTMDDHPHFEFLRWQNTVMPGLQSPRTVMQGWFDEFTYMQKSTETGILTYTMHPYVIGRGYRMLWFEDLVEKLQKSGAVFMTMEQAANAHLNATATK
ncbi:MAG: polysaccharide deacetylase family protein [Burkholderiaceae bacterium]|jgi:peptidoglycan/xylan/chitin deacetylase (PgdA/CDA1 family)